MPREAVVVLVVLLVWSIGIWQWRRRSERARRMLTSWADAQGYRVLTAEVRNMRRGPFTWGTSNAQVVFRIRVLDADDTERTGYLRLGGHWRGLSSDKTEVRWDARDTHDARELERVFE